MYQIDIVRTTTPQESGGSYQIALVFDIHVFLNLVLSDRLHLSPDGLSGEDGTTKWLLRCDRFWPCWIYHQLDLPRSVNALMRLSSFGTVVRLLDELGSCDHIVLAT